MPGSETVVPRYGRAADPSCRSPMNPVLGARSWTAVNGLREPSRICPDISSRAAAALGVPRGRSGDVQQVAGVWS